MAIVSKSVHSQGVLALQRIVSFRIPWTSVTGAIFFPP